ncbi:hypothetical protein PPIS_a3953 [Pseudoalteromonas piscicida]|uniref:Uncharacterized protein n=1 Tax=Pseudoalteromonas piscicida TaxID=43662 RepID=A0ABN5CGP6_PSEO7|nr:hypothetical protein PPIS_a3953 [Pseudoalteromonas piscicida]
MKGKSQIKMKRFKKIFIFLGHVDGSTCLTRPQSKLLTS